MICECFSHSMACFDILGIISFAAHNYCKDYLSDFFFISSTITFMSYPTIPAKPNITKFYPMISSKSLYSFMSLKKI